MEHVAIMRKSWGLTQKILSGEKTIETRWYKNRVVPWGRITVGDTIYFKDTGEPVTLKAVVWKVLQFDNLTSEKIYKLRKKYAKEIGLTKGDLEDFKGLFKGKRYGILVFLENAQPVAPFNIDKFGFGAMSAWITVPSVANIKKY